MYFSQLWHLQVHDHDGSRFGVWQGPTSWFIDWYLPAGSSHGSKDEGLSGKMSIRTPAPLMTAPPYDLITPQKPHIQTVSQCGLNFNIWTWGEHNPSVYSSMPRMWGPLHFTWKHLSVMFAVRNLEGWNNIFLWDTEQTCLLLSIKGWVFQALSSSSVI